MNSSVNIGSGFDVDISDKTEKLLVMYVNGGYMITGKDGCQMFFRDGARTSGFGSKFEAMKVCEAHGYDYDVI